MEHHPHNTARSSGYYVTSEDLSDYRIQKHVLDPPFINVAPTMPGYDFHWASYQPPRSTAGMNRAYAATGTVLRDGTMSHYRERKSIMKVPPVAPVMSHGHVGIHRKEGVSESSTMRDGSYRPKGANRREMGTLDFEPVYGKPYPDLGLMRPFDPEHIVFPGARIGIPARNIDRYEKTPFSIKFGEYMH